jgi:hypothetical protein
MTRHTKRIVTMLAAGLAALTLPGMPIVAAETCYVDDDGRIVTRRRPGYRPIECPRETPSGEDESGDPAPVATPRLPDARVQSGLPRPPRGTNPVSPVPVPRAEDYPALVPMPDRWRIVEALGYENAWWDPYHRNTLKADVPVHGDWFFNLGIISDTVYENREIPTPIGASSTDRPGGLDIFGSDDQFIVNQNLAFEFVYYKGDTVFRPPDWEYRFIPVVNVNYVQLDEVQGVSPRPGRGDDRYDNQIGIQGLFVDKHLRNVSDRYDFDSIRFGIQPFSSDFRGFLFQDNQFGLRLFGNRENNVFQYNLAWFRRIEKDTNSGLNDLGSGLRDDDVFVANLYWQDLGLKGFVSQGTILYNRNREDDFHFDENHFIQRPASLGTEQPRTYDVVYLGYNGDGHLVRVNLTASAYLAIGQEEGSPFVSRATESDSEIRAGFVAAEVSIDFDWMRPRLSFLYGSGDDDPFDDRATGFDAVFENPQFAGADASWWIRQSSPLIGGGRVALSGRNGVLASLRSSKEEGQSNFVNPGIWLIGAGIDLDLLPELRLSANWNWLRFDTTEVLEVARNQADIDEEIGHDLSLSLTWRPFMSQNIVLRASYAELLPGPGFKALYPDENARYFLFNLLLAY